MIMGLYQFCIFFNVQINKVVFIYATVNSLIISILGFREVNYVNYLNYFLYM